MKEAGHELWKNSLWKSSIYFLLRKGPFWKSFVSNAFIFFHWPREEREWSPEGFLLLAISTECVWADRCSPLGDSVRWRKYTCQCKFREEKDLLWWKNKNLKFDFSHVTRNGKCGVPERQPGKCSSKGSMGNIVPNGTAGWYRERHHGKCSFIRSKWWYCSETFFSSKCRFCFCFCFSKAMSESLILPHENEDQVNSLTLRRLLKC